MIQFRCFSGLVLLCCMLGLEAQSVQNGILDLRQVQDDFSEVKLDGDWFFYWNELVSPENTNFSKARLVKFPQLWNHMEETGYSAEGYATYQLKVLIDPDRKYAIYTPAVYNAYHFYINNELITSNGVVGETEDTTSPHWIQFVEPIERGILRDTNVFTLQISNFRHSRGGPIDSIVFGKKSALLAYRNYLFTIDALLTGALIMGGLFFLGLFLFGRNHKSILYFSLFCMAFSYYIFGSGNYIMHWLFPEIPWIITIKLEYATLYLVCILFAKYTYHSYPLDAPRQGDKIIVGVCLFFLVITIILPPAVFTRFNQYFLIFIFGGIALGFYIYLTALLNKRIGAVYAFISASMILVVLTLKNLHQFEIVDLPLFVLPAGYMVFFFLQSVTTSQQVALSWRRAKENAEASLQVKSDFLSTMSHEIRTPMNAVIGLTHHLLDSHPRNDQKSTLDILKFSSENLLRLINDVLDYSKLESGNLILEESLVDLKSLGNNLVDGFATIAEEKKSQVIFKYDPELPTMFLGDGGRLTQVLSNLLNNAIKFTTEGKVTLSMTQEERQPEGIFIRFAVEDTGIGISNNDKGKIFEKFNQANTSITRKYGGTGLGLAITKKILELQNVKIQLISELGKGSTFYFTQYFKIAKGFRKEVVRPSILMDPLKDKRVLLVEDNSVNVMVARRFLEKWHCAIDVAENGLEALNQFEEDKYDLILMDLQMPEMDGYEATRQLRARGAVLPIIALTAAALSDVEKNILEAGLDDFVVKPFHPDHLYQKLIKYMVEK